MGLNAVILADDPSMQDLLELIVHRRGHQVVPRTDPSRGETLPCCDILICDSETLLTGNLENFQAVLRQCAASPQNTVLFVDIEMENLKRARALGCKIIPKPFRLGTIFDWLDERARSIGAAGLH